MKDQVTNKKICRRYINYNFCVIISVKKFLNRKFPVAWFQWIFGKSLNYLTENIFTEIYGNKINGK